MHTTLQSAGHISLHYEFVFYHDYGVPIFTDMLNQYKTVSIRSVHTVHYRALSHVMNLICLPLAAPSIHKVAADWTTLREWTSCKTVCLSMNQVNTYVLYFVDLGLILPASIQQSMFYVDRISIQPITCYRRARSRRIHWETLMTAASAPPNGTKELRNFIHLGGLSANDEGLEI